MDFEASLDRLYRKLLLDALTHVGPATTDPARRQVFARLAHFLARSTRADERLTADLLAAATASTDHAPTVRCLLCAVWTAAEGDPRLVVWFTKVAARALERGHLPAFCTVVELVVQLPSFEGKASDAWLAGIRAAREDEKGRAEAFWVGWHWQDRFYPDGGTAPPTWLVDLREDERVLAAAAIVEGERVALCCPACGEGFLAMKVGEVSLHASVVARAAFERALQDLIEACAVEECWHLHRAAPSAAGWHRLASCELAATHAVHREDFGDMLEAAIDTLTRAIDEEPEGVRRVLMTSWLASLAE